MCQVASESEEEESDLESPEPTTGSKVKQVKITITQVDKWCDKLQV